MDHRFERLAGLDGVWRGTVQHGDGLAQPTTVTYKLVSAGSALVENLFVGTEDEMVTVYHTAGGELALTHYCAMGNQPQMKATPNTEPDTIGFLYSGGVGISTQTDAHMHRVAITFVRNDHILTEWTLFDEGRPASHIRLDLYRQPRE